MLAVGMRHSGLRSPFKGKSMSDRGTYRLILSFLTMVVVILIGLALVGSWTQPQPQSQLNLYQTDLLLQASEWKGFTSDRDHTTRIRTSLLGGNPLPDAIKRYQQVRTITQTRLAPRSSPNNAPSATPSLDTNKVSSEQPNTTPSGDHFLEMLELRLGLLYARSGQTKTAIDTWAPLLSDSNQGPVTSRAKTAEALVGLWSQPPRLLPNAQQHLQTDLTGWFRDQALSQLYKLQQRQDALDQLNSRAQQQAETALLRVGLVGGLTVLGGVAGTAVLLFWLIQALLRQRQLPTEAIVNPSSPVAQTASPSVPRQQQELPSSVLWPAETIWEVMVLWFMAFFVVSSVLVPLTVLLLGLKPETLDARAQAYFAFGNYSLLVGVGFCILYLCLRRFLAKPVNWLQLHWQGYWPIWGGSGYLAALPLVVLTSLLNQKILQNQGGGNPLLDIIVQSHDGLTMALLFIMVAFLAPLFEEILFRGFFLTSLTRFLPLWQAIVYSALLFAIAHLNLADVLPLTVLGCVLGSVYVRSRNLLSSMLLHSLWNSGSFLGLLILGSSSN